MMKYHNKLTIILISYKSEKKIKYFVKKIPKNIKTIIIENSNNFKLKKNIEDKYKNIKVFIKKNEGVSASINFAVKKIKTEFFIQISPDIVFDYKNIGKFFIIAKKLKNKFSALGPRFLNVNYKGHVQINKNLSVGSIESIHGSCMFINKKRFKEIGGFDDKFFLYFEETDYCKKALMIGLKSYQINTIKVKTKGRTVILDNKQEKSRLDNILTWHFIWSKFYYTKKYNGKFVAIVVFFPILIRIFFRITLYKVINDKKKFKKYKFRLKGLLSSILGMKSNLRP